VTGASPIVHSFKPIHILFHSPHVLQFVRLFLSIVRRGLAMMIESDFYTTPAGREHFSNQLQSIR